MKEKRLEFPYLLTDIFMVLAFTVFVLYPGTNGYLNIQQEKFSVFCLLFGGYLFLMGLFSLEMMLAGRIRPISPVQLWKSADWIQRCIFLFWFASVLSTLFSPYRTQALLGMSRNEGLLTISIYCGCFLCVSVFAHFHRWWLYLLGIVLTIFDLICLLQIKGFNPLSLFPAGCSYLDADIKYGGSYLGTIGNADLAAAFLCLVFPLFLVFLLRGHDKIRLLLCVPLILTFIVLVAMDVQAGLVGLLAGTLLIAPIAAPVSREKRKYLWLTVIILCGVLLLWLRFGADVQSGTLYEFQQVLRGNWDKRFGNGRIYIWDEVLKRIPEQLLLGSGPDTMAAAQILGYTRPVPGLEEGQRFIVDMAHNEYLNILYHQGLLALLPYLAALGLTFVQWIRTGGKNLCTAVLGSALIFYCIQAFFSFSMCHTAGLFWLIWALMDRALRTKNIL